MRCIVAVPVKRSESPLDFVNEKSQPYVKVGFAPKIGLASLIYF